jgi:hypothetical protein
VRRTFYRQLKQTAIQKTAAIKQSLVFYGGGGKFQPTILIVGLQYTIDVSNGFNHLHYPKPLKWLKNF